MHRNVKLLFDHLVSGGEKARRDRETDRSARAKVPDRLLGTGHSLGIVEAGRRAHILPSLRFFQAGEVVAPSTIIGVPA
jgi:hypothetical protein